MDVKNSAADIWGLKASSKKITYIKNTRNQGNNY
jgi:hypothetical protein